ncbi:MAG: hypothetical protein LBB55_05675 [Zoogloeaceae bacterium]|jgi:hypothetical protein|nr:hypothetical protein [Zoogloeaceae bacterium]
MPSRLTQRILADPRYGQWVRARQIQRRKLAYLTLLFLAAALFLLADARPPLERPYIAFLLVAWVIIFLLAMLREYGKRSARVFDRQITEVIRQARETRKTEMEGDVDESA